MGGKLVSSLQALLILQTLRKYIVLMHELAPMLCFQLKCLHVLHDEFLTNWAFWCNYEIYKWPFFSIRCLIACKIVPGPKDLFCSIFHLWPLILWHSFCKTSQLILTGCKSSTHLYFYYLLFMPNRAALRLKEVCVEVDSLD